MFVHRHEDCSTLHPSGAEVMNVYSSCSVYIERVVSVMLALQSDQQKRVQRIYVHVHIASVNYFIWLAFVVVSAE